MRRPRRVLAGVRLTSPRLIDERERHIDRQNLKLIEIQDKRMARQEEQQRHEQKLQAEIDVGHRGAARSRRAD